jgi:hypothetical protein
MSTDGGFALDTEQRVVTIVHGNIGLLRSSWCTRKTERRILKSSKIARELKRVVNGPLSVGGRPVARQNLFHTWYLLKWNRLRRFGVNTMRFNYVYCSTRVWHAILFYIRRQYPSSGNRKRWLAHCRCEGHILRGGGDEGGDPYLRNRLYEYVRYTFLILLTWIIL